MNSKGKMQLVHWRKANGVCGNTYESIICTLPHLKALLSRANMNRNDPWEEPLHLNDILGGWKVTIDRVAIPSQPNL